jgi:hypothetical protein
VSHRGTLSKIQLSNFDKKLDEIRIDCLSLLKNYLNTLPESVFKEFLIYNLND